MTPMDRAERHFVPFWEKDFGAISGGPPSPGPFVLLLSHYLWRFPEKYPWKMRCFRNPAIEFFLGVSQTTPLTLLLLQKHRDRNGRRIMIQIGGGYTAFCQEEGILLQKYRDRNGRCVAILFKSIGVMGRCASPEFYYLSGTKIASQNRSDHCGRKRARNHSTAEIAGFSASPAARQ